VNRAEDRKPADFIDDARVDLPESVGSILSSFSKEKALALIEEPPMNPLEYFFDPDFENRKKYPWPATTATILQLFEILLACGHARWIAEELPGRNRRLWIVAALSGHPLMVESARWLFEMPELEACLARLRKKRQTLDDIVALSDAAMAHPSFRAALADAISTYGLTCDVFDSLIDPLEWFEGLDKASPGKLCYFFVRAPADYPIFDAMWKEWAFGTKPPWGDFTSSSGAMLYTTCYHYRAAVIGEALRAQTDTVETLLHEMDARVAYYQSGSVEAFNRDTTKMASELLPKSSRDEGDHPDAAQLVELLVEANLLRLRDVSTRGLLEDLTRCLFASASVSEISELLVDHPAVDELYASDEELQKALERIS
jgi:hypothetical protein